MNKNAIALVLLLLAFACTNMFWLSYDTAPPHWDTANHMLSALKYHEAMSSYLEEGNWLSIKSIKTVLRKLLAVDQSRLSTAIPVCG